ncbi:MAG: hypothetical protein ISS81_05425 [Candidatus Marinimicrobia bacterium]|nr:hypothetical protein [Candidatus Neomarinimicrobiota bacterium]
MGIIFLFLKPVLQWTKVRNLSPKLLVWIDNSLSMTAHKDFSPDILMESIKNMDSELKKENIDIIYDIFSDDIESETHLLDKVVFNGLSTDISHIIKESKSKHVDENISAAILISDGVVTKGEDPSLMEINLLFPIFTIGIGDSMLTMDPSISQIELPQFAKVGDSVEIRAEIVPLGDGKPLEIILKENGKIIQKKMFETQLQAFNREVIFHVVPDEVGVRKYEIEIEKANDANPYNNIRMGLLRVYSAETNIVVLNARAGFESRFLIRSFEKIENVKIYSLVETASSWIPLPLSSIIREKWDVVVLFGYPSDKTNMDQLQSIKQKIENESVPMLIIYDRPLSLERVNILVGETIIEGRVNDRSKETVLVQLTWKGESHPIIRDALFSYDFKDLVRSLPPIGWPFKNLILGSGFVNLITTANLSEHPVIAIRDFGEERMAVCSGMDFWRWCFMTQGSGEVDLYTKTFTGLIKWLSDTLSTSNIQMSLDKSIYLSGEPAEISGLVFDVQGKIIQSAVVKGIAISENGDEQPFAIQWDGSQFKGEIPLRLKGDYRIKVIAQFGDNELGVTEKKLTVVDQPIELSDIMQKADVLRSISYKTCGKKINIDDLQSILNFITIEKKEIEEKHELKLWRWYGSFVFIICLLFVEWIIRRINGYQ